MTQSPPERGVLVMRRRILQLLGGLTAVGLLGGMLGACTGDDDGTTPSSPTTAPTALPSSPAAESTTFTSDEPAFSISFPIEWSSIQGLQPGDPAVQAVGKTGESVTVTLQQLLAQTSLAQYTKDNVAALESTGLTVEGTDETTMGGLPAGVIRSTSDEGPGFQLIQTFVIKDDLVYVVTYAAPPRSFDEARSDALVASFAFG